MAVNVKLLRRIRRLIVARPARVNMTDWLVRVEKSQSHPCGTVACLAGWAILANEPVKKWPEILGRWYARKIGQIDVKAAGLLGLPTNECPFYQIAWKASDVVDWIDGQIAEANAR